MAKPKTHTFSWEQDFRTMTAANAHGKAASRTRKQRDELLVASRRIEAHSHWNNAVYGYVVSKGAMDALCRAIGKARNVTVRSLQNAVNETERKMKSMTKTELKLKDAEDGQRELERALKSEQGRRGHEPKTHTFSCGSKNADDLIEQLENVLPKFGVHLTAHPSWEGQSDYGFIVSDRPLTKAEIAEEVAAIEDYG
jgi:hypothetical protein